MYMYIEIYFVFAIIVVVLIVNQHNKGEFKYCTDMLKVI